MKTSVNGPKSIDTAVIVGRRDLPLLRIFIQSFSYFSRLNGRLLIFYDGMDLPSLRRMRLPEDVKLIEKSSVADLSGDGYRDQMVVKLNVDRYCDAPYIWVADCDFIITRPLFPGDFFRNDRPIWMYRDWDNPASLAWRDPTERILNASIPFQFMDRPQYLLVSDLLRDLRRRVDVTALGTIEPKASEYMLYAAFCHAHHRDAYAWDCPSDDEESLTYSVNQRPPSYHVLDPETTLDRAGASKIVIFWSHWALAEPKMKTFLAEAVQRHCLVIQDEIEQEFYFVLVEGPSLIGQVRSAGLIYEDLWLKPDCRFFVETSGSKQMSMAISVIGDPSNVVRLVVGEGPTAVSLPLEAGENEVRVDLSGPGQHLFAFEVIGGVAEVNGSRILSARLSDMRLG